ncbi:response regulator transcription factor [Bradyrhizobium iriomotense]|uniref:DNA-binding response regulator n=1 Tax=Bradyrhizobium iriomotense TaxID=441950 RepID=A0ABQ6B8Y7_9BRAD|nr:response regulator [Bradyrhizobium iriomotense]GLR90845.1 DNA-binding response regulator [Bradyrhizobium iriomotense]
MTDKRTTIAIIDSDDLLQARLQVLIGAAGLTASLFTSAEEYLSSNTSKLVNCIVLDVPLPGMSGLDLQFRLAKAKRETPLVFLTAQNDVRTSVRAMKAGAVDFLTKPFIDEELLDAVKRGVERDRSARLQSQTLDVLYGRLTSLSPRERETMTLLSSGQSPKQIAEHLGVCTHTARVHSSRLMAKMGARSIADLVRMVDRLGICVMRDGSLSTQMQNTTISRRPDASSPSHPE